jgi:hypothetical protein
MFRHHCVFLRELVNNNLPGNATLILNTTDYKLKIAALLGDSAYKKLDKDPTDSIERKTIKIIEEIFTS